MTDAVRTQPSNAEYDIPVPAEARAQSTLAAADYANALRVSLDQDPDVTAEQWARAILEEAPAEARHRLAQAWSGLGLDLGPIPSEQHVLGWLIRRRTPEVALLGADSVQGLHAELLIVRQPGALIFASFIRCDNERARAAWAVVESRHAPMMHHLLVRAVSPSGRG